MQFGAGGREVGDAARKSALGGDFAERVDPQHADQLAFRIDFLPHAFDNDQDVNARLPDHQVGTDLPDANAHAVDGQFGNEAVFFGDQLGDEFRAVGFDDVAE